MKTIPAAFLLIPVFCFPVRAQLIVDGGAFVKSTPGATISLHNTDLVVNGTIDQSPANGTFLFSGSDDNTFSGSAIPVFDKMVIAKSRGRLIQHQNFLVGSSLTFVSGFIDLNNSLLQIRPGGVISGESAAGHILSSGNGYVYTTTSLNAPAAVNPGNLGAVITSSADMGVTTIRRRHTPRTVAPGSSGIARYYEIYPTHNTGLDATLRLYYSDDELNTLDENTLTLWKNAGSWSDEGYTTRDTVDNYVEKQGIPSFSSWTLASSSTSLPVTLAGFGVSGTGAEGVSLRWVTASESNTREFSIERSLLPVKGFAAIGVVPATGASNGAVYRYTDIAAPAGRTCYYRLRMTDTDGSFTFSNMVSAQVPGGAGPEVYPNPAASEATIFSGEDITGLDIFSLAGTRMAAFRYEGLSKKQLLCLETLPPGTYLVRVTGPQGAFRTTRLVISR